MQLIDKTRILETTISFLRFPLIIGVILIHANLSEVIIGGIKCFNKTDYPIYTYVSYVLSQIIARTAVPLFFLISGFLFFYKIEIFNFDIFLQKIKKRIRTLFIPYIFWNFLIILIYLIGQSIVPNLISGGKKLICDYNFTDWLLSFWDTNLINPAKDIGMPINYPLWFIRDLMVVIMFSPLIYFLVKK